LSAFACACSAFASDAKSGMQALADDELAAVRGADGIAFNLNNFSLTSSTDLPFTLTYLSPGGSSLTLSRLDLKRTDDPDPFADPYLLDVLTRPGLPDMISLTFPQNTAGNQAWTITADFSHCGAVSLSDDSCASTPFYGGTLQLANLTMKGGGLYLAPSAVANTQGIAFGLGTQLDIGTLGIYSHGRDVADAIDQSDSLVFSGIHIADATTGGAWMIADLAKHPGLFNAVTDANGSYLHLQIGWPTTSDPVPGAAISIGDISFSNTPAGGGSPTVTSFGSSNIASMQINYLDIKFKPGK
ncbi:MAG TPA: hypothetical protein VIP05_34240, partial [Burkholderiaceae bacterium]